jgi:hypothetical protein
MWWNNWTHLARPVYNRLEAIDCLALACHLSYLGDPAIVQLLVYLQSHDKKSLAILFDRLDDRSDRPSL